MTDIQALRDLIETERVRFDVPGVAVAVVIDGEVVLAEGFGVRDVATGAPVTGRTLFPIASDSKNFTAAALCQLADEGDLDLDAPVKGYVPWFRMADPHATELVSTRDLLAHRTGLPRHDFVWYGSLSLDLEDIVRRLADLPLNKQPRQTWQYNNLCYSTAGYLTEHLTGLAWTDVITNRLLAPLGMKSTSFTSEDWATGDFATPYNKIEGALEAQLLPPKTKLGPPGGIVSCAEDMGRWALARLGKEPDVLSEGALAQLHAPAMIGGVGVLEAPERQPMGYALGCQVESYRGTRIIRHGGNLVGYSSDVCVVPGLNAAIVTLTNMHGTALRDALALLVLDRILDLEPVAWGEKYHEMMSAGLAGAAAAREHEAAAAEGRPTTRPLGDFAGTYDHPSYGTITLTEKGEALGIDFHGLDDNIRIHHRDRDVFDVEVVEFQMKVPVVFTTGSDSAITGLQIPIEPLVPPILFTKSAPPVAPGLLDKIAGDYVFGPITMTVRVQDGKVVVAAQGSKLPLEPLGGTVFRSPAMSTVRAEFELDENGAVTRLVLNPMGVFEKI